MANRAQLLATRRKAKKGIKIPRTAVLKVLRVALLLIVIIILVFAIPRLIPVRTIICETDKERCSSNLEAKILSVSATNLSQSKGNLHRVLREQISVENYSIRFQLPSTLVVYVIEREPIVAIAREGATSDFALVDSEGVIVGIWPTTDLPIMIVGKDSQYQTGQKLPSDLLQAVVITEQSFKKFNSRLSTLKTDVLEVELPSGIRVVFPLSGDLDLLFGSLSLILSRVNSDTIKLLPSIIDLRYKNPVIK